jgi:polysaccharide export outer membrane protein
MRTSLPHISALLIAILAVSAACTAAETVKGSPAATARTDTTAALPDYGIQPGDVLTVSVWKEEGLQSEVLVRPDGGISFPLVGDVSAAGKSVQQLSALISERLVKYIPDPVVTVSMKALSGNAVYVIGKVNKPGEFPVTHYVDVMQALSMAGGTNPFAALNDIKVLRRVGGKQSAISFRYGDVESGKKLEQNIILKSGDIIVVP